MRRKSLKDNLLQYAEVYNNYIPQKNIGHMPPIEAMKIWQNSHPQLFKKKVYKLTGLDNYRRNTALLLKIFSLHIKHMRVESFYSRLVLLS